MGGEFNREGDEVTKRPELAVISSRSAHFSFAVVIVPLVPCRLTARGRQVGAVSQKERNGDGSEISTRVSETRPGRTYCRRQRKDRGQRGTQERRIGAQAWRITRTLITCYQSLVKEDERERWRVDIVRRKYEREGGEREKEGCTYVLPTLYDITAPFCHETC